MTMLTTPATTGPVVRLVLPRWAIQTESAMAPPGIHRTLVKVAPKQRSKAQEELGFFIASPSIQLSQPACRQSVDSEECTEVMCTRRMPQLAERLWPRAGGYARASGKCFGHLFHSVLVAIL